MIRFNCPHCRASFQVREDLSGRAGTCARCDRKLRIPLAPVRRSLLLPALAVLTLVAVGGLTAWVVATNPFAGSQVEEGGQRAESPARPAGDTSRGRPEGQKKGALVTAEGEKNRKNIPAEKELAPAVNSTPNKSPERVVEKKELGENTSPVEDKPPVQVAEKKDPGKTIIKSLGGEALSAVNPPNDAGQEAKKPEEPKKAPEQPGAKQAPAKQAAPTVKLAGWNAVVRFKIGNEVYVAALPKELVAAAWLVGPLVSEGRVVVVPVESQDKAHPYLRVLFDLRAYKGGGKRLDVTVENTLNVDGATAVTYDVDIKAGGKTLFQRANVKHYYLARWRKVFALGLTESLVTPDFEPFIRARAMPRYLTRVADQNYSTAGATFDLLKRGGLAYDAMGAPGGRPELGPYPDWVATYQVHRKPHQRAYLLVNGDLAGSQPVHIREADGTLVSIDRHPKFWLDFRGKDNGPLADRPKGDLSGAARGPLGPDMQHQPSLAYVPYLVTGDRFYADEMKFWANFNLLAVSPFYTRNDSQGSLFGDFANGPNDFSLTNQYAGAARHRLAAAQHGRCGRLPAGRRPGADLPGPEAGKQPDLGRPVRRQTCHAAGHVFRDALGGSTH